MVKGKICGTNSKTIYLEIWRDFKDASKCCEKYGRQNRNLYCDNATPEGYGVWFICHHSLNGETNNRHFNEIIDDKTIVEHYIEGAVDVDNVKRDDKRVVFVKRGKKYVFYGVFTAEPCKNENKIIYKRIADKY